MFAGTKKWLYNVAENVKCIYPCCLSNLLLIWQGDSADPYIIIVLLYLFYMIVHIIAL